MAPNRTLDFHDRLFLFVMYLQHLQLYQWLKQRAQPPHHHQHLHPVSRPRTHHHRWTIERSPCLHLKRTALMRTAHYTSPIEGLPISPSGG